MGSNHSIHITHSNNNPVRLHHANSSTWELVFPLSVFTRKTRVFVFSQIHPTHCFFFACLATACVCFLFASRAEARGLTDRGGREKEQRRRRVVRSRSAVADGMLRLDFWRLSNILRVCACVCFHVFSRHAKYWPCQS
jgi:hypothetical protein